MQKNDLLPGFNQPSNSSAPGSAPLGSHSSESGGIPGLDLLNPSNSNAKPEFNVSSASNLIPKQQELIQTPADSKPFDFPSPAKQQNIHVGSLPPLMNFPPPGYLNPPFNSFPPGSNPGLLQGKGSTNQSPVQLEGSQGRKTRFSDNTSNIPSTFGGNWNKDSPKNALLPTPNIQPFPNSTKTDGISNPPKNSYSDGVGSQPGGPPWNEGRSRDIYPNDGHGFGREGFKRLDGPGPFFRGNDSPLSINRNEGSRQNGPHVYRDGNQISREGSLPDFRDAPPPGYRNDGHGDMPGPDNNENAVNRYDKPMENEANPHRNQVGLSFKKYYIFVIIDIVAL